MTSRQSFSKRLEKITFSGDLQTEEQAKEMQSEIEELRNEGKRLENEKIMSNKDHETERALLKSHIAQLEKQLKVCCLP